LVKTISMRLKIVPLSECMNEFQKQTGVEFDVAPNIEDRKLTVVFRDKPAQEAMAMVASTLFCKWSSEGDGYRLDLPMDVRNEENRMLDAEHNVLKERIADVVKRMTDIASHPKDELTDERDQMDKEMAKLRQSRDPESQKLLNELRKQHSRFDYLGWWDIGAALRGSDNAADALASGSTLFASTNPGEALPLPVSATPTFTARVVVPGPDGKPVVETRTPSGCVAAIRVNPVTDELEVKTVATGVMPAAGQTTNKMQLLNSGEAQTKLIRMPLRRRLAEWARMLDTKMLDIKPAPPATPEVSPGYAARALTMADQLEYLADSTGISVVADAYRVPATGEQYLTGNSVGEIVRQLRFATLENVIGGTFRSENGWLLYRHPNYWRMLDSEIPESAFAPLEAKPKSGKPITLADYAEFASSLTPWQAFVFPYRAPLTRFPRLPLIKAMPALRLWASLSDGQRRIAYVSGLPLLEMDPSQKDFYRVALNELLWVGQANESFLRVLMGDANANRDLGLFALDGQNGVGPVLSGESETLDRPQPKMLTQADIEAIKQHSYAFAFGNSPRSGASFSFVIQPEQK